MQTDADLLQLIHDQGASGAFVFSWADEWFKRTWNTQESQVDERRQLWHDPLTNEQWFGVLATDSARLPDSATSSPPPPAPWSTCSPRPTRRTSTSTSPAATRPPARSRILVDSVPAAGPDHLVVVDVTAGTAHVLVRRELEPVRLYTRERIPAVDGQGEWHLFRQIMNRSYEVAGRSHDAGAGRRR